LNPFSEFSSQPWWERSSIVCRKNDSKHFCSTNYLFLFKDITFEGNTKIFDLWISGLHQSHFELHAIIVIFQYIGKKTFLLYRNYKLWIVINIFNILLFDLLQNSILSESCMYTVNIVQLKNNQFTSKNIIYLSAYESMIFFFNF
jgi:hypothetical protein